MEAQFSSLRRAKMQLTTENTSVVQIFNHARLARAFEHPTASKHISTIFIQTIIVKKKDVVNSSKYLIDKIAELFGKIDICEQFLTMEIVVI